MANKLTLAQISAEALNTNFDEIETAVNAKAELNGDATQKFNVADAVELTEAINKKQLDNSVASTNAAISALQTTLESEIATKADKTYVDSNLALKANSADVDAALAKKANTADVEAALAKKLDVSDTTVTKQGNTFNGPGQLVQLDSTGKLPAVDGSQLTGIMTSTTTPFCANSGNVDANGKADLLYAPGSGNVVAYQNIIPTTSSYTFGNTTGATVSNGYSETYTFTTPFLTLAGYTSTISYYNYYDNSKKACLTLVVNYSDGTSCTICSSYASSDTKISFTFTPNGKSISSVYAGWGYAVSDQGSAGIGQIQISTAVQVSVSTATSCYFNVGGSYPSLTATKANGKQFTRMAINSLNCSSLANGTYNVFVGETGDAYALKNTIFTQSNQPTNAIANDIWLKTLQPLSAYKYDGTTWNEFDDISLGTVTISNGVIIAAKTNRYNVNGYNGAGHNIVETYVNGTSWSRIWSDGWIEQGGYCAATYSGVGIAVTFLKPFSNANYYLNSESIVTADNGGGASNGGVYRLTGSIYTKSATGFSQWSESSGYVVGYNWEAKGY